MVQMLTSLIHRLNSVFARNFSLIPHKKFPVLLYREFGWKPLNSPADWTPKSQPERRIRRNSLLISLLAGNLMQRPVRPRTASSATQSVSEGAGTSGRERVSILTSLQNWIATLVNYLACVAGGFLRLLLCLLRRGGLLDTSHNIRPPLTEAFGIKLTNEFRQRQLPWLLVMVVQLSELLWVQPQLTCHLHVLMRQMELASCIDPRLQVCRYA